MFTASKLASIASRQNATLTSTRQLASKKANSSFTCSFVKEVSPHVKLMDDARLGYNNAQRMLRKVKNHNYSTENIRIARNAFQREKYKHERVILENCRKLVYDKSRTSRIMSHYDPSHPDADKCGYVPGSPWTGCYWRVCHSCCCCRGGENKSIRS